MKLKNRISNNNAEEKGIVFKSSIWYTASSFLTRSLGFITIPIFSRILSTAEFGSFQVFSTWLTVLTMICGIEVYSTLNRARFDYTEKDELESYISTSLMLSICVTALFLLVYLIFQSSFDKLLLMDHRLVALLFMSLFTRPAFEMFQAEQRIHYRYKLSSGISFFMILFSSLLALVMALRMNDDRLFGRTVGQYAPYVVLGLVVIGYYFIRNHKISLDKSKYALKIAIPLTLSYLSSQILLSSDKVIVQHLSSQVEVAYIGIATSCAHIMTALAQAMNAAWAPWFYDKLNKKGYSEINKTFRVYVWIMIAITFGVQLVGPELIYFLGGEAYRPAVYILPANLTSGVFTLIISQYSAFETFYKKQRYTAVITSISAIINIIVDIIGVKLFGFAAASYVTVLCHILLIGMHIYVSGENNVMEIFPLKDIFVEMTTLLLLIPLTIAVYQFDIIRYCVLLLFGAGFVAVVLKNRKLIMSYLKK